MEIELKKEALLELYPPYTSVLGPYKRNDGRYHVVLNDSNKPKGTKGKTKTISYPKALYESNNGVRLKSNETIDHDDGNHANDDDENLIVRTRSEHSELDALRAYTEPVSCIQCGKIFDLSKNQRNAKQGTAGPFCSRKCTGIYGAGVQNGKPIKERVKTKTEYLSFIK